MIQEAIARLLGISQSGDQLIHHLQRHGVTHLGPVQRDVQNPGAAFDQKGARRRHDYLLPSGLRRLGSVPSSLAMMPSMISSAPPPMEIRRPSRKERLTRLSAV